MNISKAGDEFVGHLEGFRPESYQDEAGVWTIGFGTTRLNGAPVEAGMMVNFKTALALRRGRLENTIDTINHALAVKINQNQFDALCSFVYNIGEHAFLQSSLLKAINNKQRITEDLFTRWKYVTIDNKKVVSQGLINRRKQEFELFSIED